MDTNQIRGKVAAFMPELMDELGVLVSHASCAFPGYPAEPVDAARAQVIQMLRNAGFEAGELDLEGGGYPAVWGELAGTRRRANGSAVRPLRRAARADGAGLGHRPVDAHDEGRRPPVRPRCCRRQERRRDSRRHAEGLRRQAAGDREGDH